MSIRDNERKIGNSPLKVNKTYTFATNSKFYTTVPSEYKQYYEQFVREWLRWYDGYVDWFHGSAIGNGLFSTRIAYTLVSKLAKQITGGKVLFEDLEDGRGETKKISIEKEEVNAKEAIEKWSKIQGFDNRLTKSVEWALAAGDSVMKLDAYKRGNLTVTPIRKDNYFLDTDFLGNIIKFSTLVHTMTAQVDSATGNREDNKQHYFIMEERSYINNSPHYRLSIKMGHNHGVNYKEGDFQSADVDFKDLSKSLRDEIKKLYPDITFNKWTKLPLRDLGVYHLKATEGVSFMPSLPYGESIFSNAIHLLMSYDFYYSAKITDIYLGRGKVIVPRHMDNPASNDNYYSTLSDMFYERVPYTDPSQQSPMPIQFDLRTDSWREMRNDLLQEFALALNLNPRTVASFAVPASEKPTAHEISVDQDETALTVEHKRELLETPLNAMIATVLEYYNFKDCEVLVKFSKMGQVNMAVMTNQVVQLSQNDLVDHKTALHMLFPDKTEKEIDIIIDRKKKEKDDKQKVFSTNSSPEKQERDTDVMEQSEQDYNTRSEHLPKPKGDEDSGEEQS